MPIDRYHAFGEGITYSEPSAGLKKVAAILERVVGKRWLPSRLAIWRQFSNRSILSGKNRLGSRSWCINNSGRIDAITLGERTICRGLLRIENFGQGRINIGKDVYIGDDCLLSCSDEITIGEGTLLAHGVQLFDNNSHPRNWEQRSEHWRKILGDKINLGNLHDKIDHAPIKIGSFAWLGLGVLIMRGVTIGDRAIIAPGSVVTKSIPPDVVAAGNPARVISEIDSQKQMMKEV